MIQRRIDYYNELSKYVEDATQLDDYLKRFNKSYDEVKALQRKESKL